MKFTAIVALFAAAQAIKVKQDTADAGELTDAQKMFDLADMDGNARLSIEEGLNALSKLGLTDDAVGFIARSIAENAEQKEIEEGIDDYELLDFVAVLSQIYCEKTQDKKCKRVEDLDSAMKHIRFEEITTEDIAKLYEENGHGPKD